MHSKLHHGTSTYPKRARPARETTLYPIPTCPPPVDSAAAKISATSWSPRSGVETPNLASMVLDEGSTGTPIHDPPSRGALPGIPTTVSTPNGIRTRVAALKGRCPRPLDDGGQSLAGASERTNAGPQTGSRLQSAPVAALRRRPLRAPRLSRCPTLQAGPGGGPEPCRLPATRSDHRASGDSAPR